MSDQQKLAAIRTILRDPFGSYPGLDRRERKALKAISEGKNSRELAHDLDISIRTAYNIVDRALVKVSKVEKKFITRDAVTGLVFKMLRAATRNGRKP